MGINEHLIENNLDGFTVEFTAPRTPQQNGVVERDFAFLYARIRAMLNGAGVKKDMRMKLWAECGNTAVVLDNVTVKS